MPNSIDVSKPLVAGQTHGSLTVVGTGIRSISHFTQEAIGHIRDADAVFFAVPDGVTASFIRDLNPDAYNLALHYGEDKRRLVTYVQMAEIILRAVREGKRVTAVFYGHPGFFVSPARRALNIARKEGHRTEMLPGISSTDYLFADLRIDPAVSGCQILEASDMLLRNRPVVTSSHVVLLQVGSVGDSYYSVKGFKNNKRAILFERLIELYGENHPSYHYVGATFPGMESQIVRRPLKAYRDPAVRASVHSACTFYLPPKDILPLDQEMAEKLGMGLPASSSTRPGDALPPSRTGDYGLFELDAIARLDREGLGGRERMPSKALFRVLAQMATNPDATDAYRRDSKTYVSLFSGLTIEEKSALAQRSAPALHAVALQIDRAVSDASGAQSPVLSAGQKHTAVGQQPVDTPPLVTPTSASHAEQHETEQHEAEQHVTEQHETEQHEAEQHVTEQHETEQHEAEQHVTAQHDTEQHETEQHEAEQHVTEQHETEQHEAEQHVTEQHETEQHEAEQHVTEQHETEQHVTEQHVTEQHETEQHVTEQHVTEQHDAMEQHDVLEQHVTDK
ncbi:hypothetical protein CHU95_14630 [Niveispirillum lacus]|uniref:Tetrapyrrole methylase domain-containing protein n=1 Tax=Niveispirillum lacus TaxID=1981099 RepID=A0A255YYW2_9PROT|nr:SAM-dependent methyltransferase [Niveispirillum lacus]OYQ33610.1 hypothetical protein CHU95_14630 [Niveispirillum lacus]